MTLLEGGDEIALSNGGFVGDCTQLVKQIVSRSDKIHG
jgi:hypothetical protein